MSGWRMNCVLDSELWEEKFVKESTGSLAKRVDY